MKWLAECSAAALREALGVVAPDLSGYPVTVRGPTGKQDPLYHGGYSTLEELQAHYTGGDDSMDPLNYFWYQHRWLRLAAKMFEADGEDGLVRFWDW